MTEKPILFNGDMVRAILDGRKTQTRRVLKVAPGDWFVDAPTRIKCHALDGGCYGFASENATYKCPYGKPGDSLWVRETWSGSTESSYIYKPSEGHRIWYRANNDRPTWAEGHWKPSIFMPRWASRINLEVRAVRVEQLRNISEADARAEGTNPSIVGRDLDHLKYRAGFMALWDSINAKRGYSWESNPWVWVVEFSLSGCNDAQLHMPPTKTLSS